ncbi:MAG: F0F1 ATP synthase subunit B [Patescibacteria group bacterium]
MSSTIENPTSEELTTEVIATEVQSEDPGILGTFGLRGDLFAAQLVNFLLVLIVLWRFVYKPMLAMLDKREQAIAKSMKDVEEISARVKASESERNAVLTETRKEAQAIIEAAMHETDIRKNEMIEAAKREVEHVIARGKEQLIAEREASMLAMRKDIIDIAVRAAAKIATEGMTQKKSQSLAEEVVRKMT